MLFQKLGPYSAYSNKYLSAFLAKIATYYILFYSGYIATAFNHILGYLTAKFVQIYPAKFCCLQKQNFLSTVFLYSWVLVGLPGVKI